MRGKGVGVIILVALIAGAVGAFGVYYYQNSLSQEPQGSGGSESGSEGGSTQPPNYEATAVVNYVNDGDTITVYIKKVTDPHEGVSLGENKVRFAGIDTVEYGEAGYEEATNYTENFIVSASEDKVYLDIDDLASSESGPYRGKYGRLIAVVYVKIDGQWVNVNAKTLRWGKPKGYCEQITFESEFDPSS